MSEQDNNKPADKPAEDQVKITIQPFHMEAAGRAIREFKEHADMFDGFISLAMMLVYLNAINDISVEAAFKNVYNAYFAVATNEQLLKETLAKIDDVLLEKKIILQ